MLSLWDITQSSTDFLDDRHLYNWYVLVLWSCKAETARKQQGNQNIHMAWIAQNQSDMRTYRGTYWDIDLIFALHAPPLFPVCHNASHDVCCVPSNWVYLCPHDDLFLSVVHSQCNVYHMYQNPPIAIPHGTNTADNKMPKFWLKFSTPNSHCNGTVYT